MEEQEKKYEEKKQEERDNLKARNIIMTDEVDHTTKRARVKAVSYTHLTLPTICSV